MPYVESSILVNGTIEQAYALAKDMEKYPIYMENVIQVRILNRNLSENTTLTEWITNVDGRIIRWLEKDCFHDQDYRIEYRQVSGDLKKFEGEWRFENSGQGTLITLTVNFEFGIPMLAGLLNPILKKKTQANCEAMLQAIKAKVENKSLAG